MYIEKCALHFEYFYLDIIGFKCVHWFSLVEVGSGKKNVTLQWLRCWPDAK